MTVSVVQVVNGTKVASDAATVTSTLTNAIVAGDVVVALIATNAAGTDHSMAGLGATWTRAAKDTSGLLDLWVGTGATSTGTVTATLTTSVSGNYKFLNLWHVRGASATFVGGADNATADTLVSTAMAAGPGQIFIGSGYTTDPEVNTFVSPSPSTGWVNSGNLEIYTGQRYASRVYRIPTAYEANYFSTVRSASTFHPIVRVVIGDRISGNTGRTNPIKNPSFETDLTGYTQQGGSTQTRDTTEFLFGTASMKCVINGATRAACYGTTGGAAANADSIPCTPGQTVTFSFYAKMTTTPVNMRAKIHWFNAAGAWMVDGDGGLVTPTINVWTRHSFTGTAPAGAAKYGVVLYTNGACTLYTDGWLTEVSPFADTYFDGSTTGVTGYTHSWDGTAHASASRAVVSGTRTNLLLNPSFETGVANWTGTSLTRSNTGGSYAAGAIGGSYFMTTNGGTDYYSAAVTATAGLDYTASGWLTRTASAGRTAAVSLHFYDSGGAEISAPTVTLTSLATQWVPERRAVTRTAPAGTATAKLRIQASAGGVSGDGFLLEQSPYLDSYFDGDTKATTLTHAWTGTAHASTSTQVAGAPTDGTLVTVKSREAGAWVSRPSVPRARIDGVWTVGNPKRWNGSAWVDLA